MARRIMAAFVLSSAAVIVLAAPALAVPGTLKLSSLRARSVATHGAITAALAAKPPPPPRHYQPPTTKPMPHTGPDLPAGVATGAGAALVAVGGAGLFALRRARGHSSG